jgi:cytochrome P450
MSDEIKDLKDVLDNWDKITRNIMERAFVREISQGTVSTSEIIDSVSTWLLTGTGATAALMASASCMAVPENVACKFGVKRGLSYAIL